MTREHVDVIAWRELMLMLMLMLIFSPRSGLLFMYGGVVVVVVVVVFISYFITFVCLSLCMCNDSKSLTLLLGINDEINETI